MKPQNDRKSTGLSQQDAQLAIELMPWLLNGTLDGEEQAMVREAAASDAEVLAELEATTQMWQMTDDEHLPTMSLSEYALGLEPSEVSRVEIEAHLAKCSSCQEELSLVQADTVVDFEQAARKRHSTKTTTRVLPGHQTAWRYLAAAAVIVAATGALAPRLVDSDSSLVVTDFHAPQEATVEESLTLQPASFKPSGSGAIFADGFEDGGSGWTFHSEQGSS